MPDPSLHEGCQPPNYVMTVVCCPIFALHLPFTCPSSSDPPLENWLPIIFRDASIPTQYLSNPKAHPSRQTACIHAQAALYANPPCPIPNPSLPASATHTAGSGRRLVAPDGCVPYAQSFFAPRCSTLDSSFTQSDEVQRGGRGRFGTMVVLHAPALDDEVRHGDPSRGFRSGSIFSRE